MSHYQTVDTRLGHYSPPLGCLVGDFMRAVQSSTREDFMSRMNKGLKASHKKQQEEYLVLHAKRVKTLEKLAKKSSEGVTREDAAKAIGASKATAKKMIDDMVKSGHLQHVGKRQWTNIYKIKGEQK